MTIYDEIHHVAKRKFWKDAMALTAKALTEGKIVRWSLKQESSLDYAEWLAGNPMTWKANSYTVLSWSFWSIPSPARRVGGSWTGGEQSEINQGGRVTLTSEQAARFIETATNFATP